MNLRDAKKVPDDSYPHWRELKKYVLRPAVEEVNRYSEETGFRRQLRGHTRGEVLREDQIQRDEVGVARGSRGDAAREGEACPFLQGRGGFGVCRKQLRTERRGARQAARGCAGLRLAGLTREISGVEQGQAAR